MKRITFEQLVEIVEGDRELILLLVTEQVIEQHPDGFEAQTVDRVLASRTLIRELEVNIAGVDIILRLREELAEARKRIAELEGPE